MKTNLLLILAVILVVGGGASLVIFMNSLWDDNTFLTFIDSDTDSDSDVDDYSHYDISGNYPL